MANLFLDTKIDIQKYANETQLSDNADQWQQEIASTLYQQAPYISNYATDVVLDKVDAERGYAYGKATLKNKYDMPQPQADTRSVNVPIIVKDRMLKPFDMYTYENKSFPLNEQRISQTLFSPQPLELTDRKPTDKMLTYQMSPPTRSHINATVSNAGFGKYASDGSSLLDAISSTITDVEKKTFLSKIANHPGLTNAYLTNDAFRNGVNKIASAKLPEVSVKPTVVQLTKLSHNTFAVKLANVNRYEPEYLEADINTIANQIGDTAYNMAPGESRTYSTINPIPTKERPVSHDINTPGTFTVQDSLGNSSTGAVLPVTSFDGKNTGDSLFVNNNAFAIQEKIAGVKVANEVDINESIPSGYGTFYSPSTNSVTEPIQINYSTQNQSGSTTHVGIDRFGNQINAVRNPMVTKLAYIGGNSYAVPTSSKWISLPNAEVSLKSSEDNIKTASIDNLSSTVEVRRNGDQYSFSGRPVSNLSKDETQFLSKEGAEWLLATMGVSTSRLDSLNGKTYMKVAGARTIMPVSMVTMVEKRASDRNWKLNKDLIKEAALIPEEETVDKILALGFLKPDNVKKFAGYLPELEKTTNKLADLLFASRCGLSSVPEDAIESAMRNTDQIISGLRTLQEQQNTNN